MKPLLIARLYSHVLPNILSKRWEPMGMPAFYKLVEGLDASCANVNVALLCRLPEKEINNYSTLRFEKLPNTTFHIIPHASWTKHMRIIRKIIVDEKIDVVHTDRSNAPLGGMLTWTNIPVVLRMHGVANLMNVPLMRKGIIPSLEILSYKARFKHVIFSKDGSPVERFARKRLAKNTHYDVLFNGVDDLPKTPQKKAKRKKTITMSGRLDKSKSPLQFVETLGALLKKRSDFSALLIGSGELENDVRNKIDSIGVENKILMTGRLPHEALVEKLGETDIFVSLNHYGNLSNCVLEALKAGLCVVTFEKCARTGRDDWDAIPDLKQALTLIPRNDIPQNLTHAINTLLDSPNTITEKAKLAAEFAENNIPSWDKRIQLEIEIMSRAATGGSTLC